MTNIPHTAAPVADQLAFDDWWANVRQAEDAHHAAEEAWNYRGGMAPAADRAELAAECRRLVKTIPAGALRPTLDRLAEPIIAAIERLASSREPTDIEGYELNPDGTQDHAHFAHGHGPIVEIEDGDKPIECGLELPRGKIEGEHIGGDPWPQGAVVLIDQPSSEPARSTDAPSDEWTLIAPDGMRFSGASPLRAASAAARHGIQTDPVKAKHFHDAIASFQAENDAENARLLAEHGTLNCPACGGSGHIGDVATSPAAATSTPCASGEGDDKCPSCRGSGVIGIPGAKCPFCKMHELGKRYAATQAPAVPAATQRQQRLDASMAKFDALGPLPGMIAAFETHYGQKWTDPDWRNEASVWATSWALATRTSTAGNTEDARSMGASEIVQAEPWLKSDEVRDRLERGE